MKALRPNLVVAGSLNIDIVGRVTRRPLPGETVVGSQLSFHPGGKGLNQAVAASRAGASVALCGAVGDDDFGDRLVDFLVAENIDLSHVERIVGGSTGSAMIVVDEGGENAIVVFGGANEKFSVPTLPLDFALVDVLVAQFETSVATTLSLFRQARDCGVTCVLNPAPIGALSAELLACVDVLILNEVELAGYTDPPSIGALIDDPARALRIFRERGLAGSLVLTLGERGAIVVDDGGTHRIAGRPVAVVDTTGAGDCLVGYLAAGLGRDDPLVVSLEAGVSAASLSVQRPGAADSFPSREEVARSVDLR
jgi:ribokinase